MSCEEDGNIRFCEKVEALFSSEYCMYVGTQKSEIMSRREANCSTKDDSYILVRGSWRGTRAEVHVMRVQSVHVFLEARQKR